MSSRKNTSPIKKADPGDYTQAVFVLDDQLNIEAWPGWLKERKPLLVFIESEAIYRSLPYHKMRLTYLISSMRHFALDCKSKGFPVDYRVTEKHYGAELEEVLEQNKDLELTFMTPSEWDSREQLQELKQGLPERISEIPNAFFLADPDNWKGKIQPGYRMEYFYREMRQHTGYLMEGDKPGGGKWNFDEENRKSLPESYKVPSVTAFKPDDVTLEVVEYVEQKFRDHFGKSSDFCYAVTRSQALQLLDEFIEERLEGFGPYEDAMATNEFTLFHSRLSMYLNNGLLLPGEICERAIKAYREGKVPLNSVEGLVRQIIGWREFVRIYYEAMMPEVRQANSMNFTEALPGMFWTGETKMYCMHQCLKPVIDQGYSHHIQRLMVLSNFSNLTKTDPGELNRWFRFAYVDAYEWVVLPNVLGMSTFADGGVLASKPYVSSGNYINKMSDYCRSCSYSVAKRKGENACPFNYLYWNFVNEQREAFEKSGRNSFMVNMYDKKADKDKKAVKQSAEKFLNELKRGYRLK